MNEKILHEARELIAGFLKERRLELGMTIDQVADHTGLGRMTIMRMENANFWPGLKQYLILCEALHLFPFLVPFESDHQFAKMMRDNWTKKQGKDMSIDEALQKKRGKHIRPDSEN